MSDRLHGCMYLVAILAMFGVLGGICLISFIGAR